MEENEILGKLSVLFRQVFDDETIVATPEMTAKDVEKWDSLAHIDMIILVEESFGIRVPMREVASLNNVGDLIKVIQSKLS